MRRIDILNALVAMGYKAEETETVKNGVIMEGIVIKDSDPVAPVIYTQKIIEQAEKDEKSIADVVKKILEVYEENKTSGFDITCLHDPEYVKDRAYVGIQRKSEEKILKRESELEGLELYLYVRMQKGQDFGIVKLNRGIVGGLGISDEELWVEAERNTCAETITRSLSEVLGLWAGDEDDPMGITVLSNTSGVRGAAAIIDKKLLRMYADRKGVNKIIVLPSSIHEVLLLPDYGNFDIREMDAMVSAVNAEEVSPEERLTDRSYVIEV